MKNLKLIRQSLKDIAIQLAKNDKIQRLLIIDDSDVDSPTFSPYSVDKLIEDGYICLTPQNEIAIEKLGRNTFLIITIQDINLHSTEDNTSVIGRIFIVTDIAHAIIKNYEDRCLTLADLILQTLDGLKVSSAGQIDVTYINRMAYNELLSGYQITFRYNDHNGKVAEI